MGIWDTITDLVEAAKPWTTAEAEAPAEEPQEEEQAEEEEEEEEEEDEDEPKDPKEQLEEACKNSKQCAPAKHHFDECVERVTNASDEGEAGEDCVEECKGSFCTRKNIFEKPIYFTDYKLTQVFSPVFHLAHCASQCAAPKLWSILK
ncbi:Non-heme 11 kDa protein of cytochrome bc1 complex [Daldinia loculata]|uniref:Non-heme 11 kDa protein of cytochrome bc1 complex n=1 Tax=Daldinia loculata TaxID=103429 RepID=UPI0020C1E4E0|nr:Non-heme 11 kDa protein of cytochrome bc1 complex [Daldinia loculata]KAI1649439.1 Non-heme 11 kDa protein of cytochrome bc1 complex [Daldinia loculata]